MIDDDIIVTMPGTAYSVAYYKPAKSPSLLAKRIADKDDPRADLSLSDFLAAAWHLANLKARELGWIVLARYLPLSRMRTLDRAA